MKNLFGSFLAANREKIFEHAEKNSKPNSKGQATISRDDQWFYEDEWDELFQTLNQPLAECTQRRV